MGGTDWFERVKENFDDIFNMHAEGPLLELYKSEEFIVSFIEYEKERAIEFGLADPDSPLNVFKYSETETYFYAEFEESMCNCKNENCGAPKFRKRIIFDNTEVLIAHMEHFIATDLLAMELVPHLTGEDMDIEEYSIEEVRPEN